MSRPGAYTRILASYTLEQSGPASGPTSGSNGAAAAEETRARRPLRGGAAAGGAGGAATVSHTTRVRVTVAGGGPGCPASPGTAAPAAAVRRSASRRMFQGHGKARFTRLWQSLCYTRLTYRTFE